MVSLLSCFRATALADAYCLMMPRKARVLGNHFFVTKRYVFSRCSEDELLARAMRRIRSPNEAQAEPTIVHGEVALDLSTRRVTAAGIGHDLTAREFTMLEFFFVTRGKLFLESSCSQGSGA
jgi:DNA-binding response OmpR family regulator